MKVVLVSAAIASSIALAGCGYTTTDRAVSGAGLGAAGGAAIGAITGEPLTGALIGGAAGGLGGALTRQDQVDLGRPLWRR